MQGRPSLYTEHALNVIAILNALDLIFFFISFDIKEFIKWHFVVMCFCENQQWGVWWLGGVAFGGLGRGVSFKNGRKLGKPRTNADRRLAHWTQICHSSVTMPPQTSIIK